MEEEAAFDANLESDPTTRRQLTSGGSYPDVIIWLARNRKRWDPQTGEFTSEMVDDTALKTLQVRGETNEPPAGDGEVRAGNLSIQSDTQGVSAEAVTKKALSLPVSGLPSAEDEPVTGKRGKIPRYGRRGKGRKNKEPLLTEMTGQSGVVEAPVIYVK